MVWNRKYGNRGETSIWIDEMEIYIYGTVVTESKWPLFDSYRNNYTMKLKFK